MTNNYEKKNSGFLHLGKWQQLILLLFFCWRIIRIGGRIWPIIIIWDEELYKCELVELWYILYIYYLSSDNFKIG